MQRACTRARLGHSARGVAWIAACALLVFGLPRDGRARDAFSIPRDGRARDAFSIPRDGRARDAFSIPPDGCSLGIGGPALDPAHSLRAARDDAFAALAAARLGVDLEVEVGWEGARVRERSSERAEGVLQGVWIAALRARPDGGIEAVACEAGSTGRAQGRMAREDRWPPGLHRRPGCALGVAGPGPASSDRTRLAWQDAREMLARGVEARIVHALELDGGIGLRRSRSVQATPRAHGHVGGIEASLQRRSWLDRRGRGPLGRPGLLYAQLCLPDGAADAHVPSSAPFSTPSTRAARSGLAQPGPDS